MLRLMACIHLAGTLGLKKLPRAVFLTPSTESAPKKKPPTCVGGFLFSMYLETQTPSVRYAGHGYAELSAAGGGESEAEHWAVPQSSASGGSPRSNATRHNRVESLKVHQKNPD